ncbi:hypothetical protein FRC02_006357 [Tulasnella sp. 418]|nr:hypothetical protein FRC02_006357 [Tulasnella sp. 418]
MSSVREFIDRWHKRPDESRRIDIIVNNAGAFVERRTITSSGLEKTYQINHLGPFLLTLSLIQSAYITPTARIVMVSSNQIYASDRLTLDLLNSPDIVGKVEIGQPLNFIDAMRTYARSKAMQLVFTIELQRRLEISGTWRNVTVNCCHPGTVKSSIWEGLERTFLTNIAARIAFATGITPEQGATTPVWLATAPEPAHEDLRGRYWARCRWRWIPAWMQNKQTTVALWEQWCRDAGIENPL